MGFTFRLLVVMEFTFVFNKVGVVLLLFRYVFYALGSNVIPTILVLI